MEWVLVALVAAAVSALTLFSGFGLGTLLLPVFALFFPLPVAVAATAVVHVLNNLLKAGLLYRHAVGRIVLAFGLPAMAAAFAGARALDLLARETRWASWHWGPLHGEITPVGFVLGFLIVGFGVLEFAQLPGRWSLSPRWLPLGGVVAGFFGGLSGHQGALRATFLRRLDLAPTAFVATQSILATMVDLARITVYGATFLSPAVAPELLGDKATLVLAGTLGALTGTLVGRRLLHKATVNLVRRVSGGLLLIVGSGLALGVL